jgi:16S rRNA (uracil1498-N3)-methyltransferase
MINQIEPLLDLCSNRVNMRLHRFYISPKDLDHLVFEQEITLNYNEFSTLLHQWRDVFRYKTGDRIYIFNEQIGEWLLEFISLDKKHGAVLKTIEQENVASVSRPYRDITLYMSIIKNSNFDLVVEKTTELGVTKIVPVKTERTIKSNLNFERLNRIAIEATEQSGRITPPVIDEMVSLETAIHNALDNQGQGNVYFGHISNVKGSQNNEAKESGLGPVAVFMGPEGGWTDQEVDLFLGSGILPITLGQFVLRAETAAITSMAIFGG